MQHPAASRLSQLTLAILAASLAAPVLAQAVPDAGSLLQQNRPPLPPPPIRPTPEAVAEPAALAELPGPTVDVRAFRFEGRTLLPQATLDAVVARYQRAGVTFSELQRAAAEVGAAYRAAGWVVRSYLPQQDVTDGLVVIRVVEARFGGVSVEAAADLRLDQARAAAVIEAAQPPGEPLNADALERGLLILNDLPGIQASGSLREGNAAGQTILSLKLSDGPMADAQLTLDNHGSPSTGAKRAQLTAALNNPLGLGDQLTVQGIVTSGSDYLRAGWSASMGATGLRLGTNASVMNYKLISEAFAQLEANGHSETLGLEMSYPLIRSRQTSLTLNTRADVKRFSNVALGVANSRYTSRIATLEASGYQFDSLLGGGATSGQLSLIGGQLDLTGSPNQAADALTTQTGGKFAKLRGSLSRQQSLSDKLSASATLSAQWASKNLDSSEKFFLGGAQGVRAYPSSEGGGSDGVMLNLALKWQLPAGLSLNTHYDGGRVRQNHRNDFVGAPLINSYTMQGVGLGLGWQSNFGLSLSATLARPIGAIAKPADADKGDTSAIGKRQLWLTAQLLF